MVEPVEVEVENLRTVAEFREYLDGILLLLEEIAQLRVPSKELSDTPEAV